MEKPLLHVRKRGGEKPERLLVRNAFRLRVRIPEPPCCGLKSLLGAGVIPQTGTSQCGVPGVEVRPSRGIGRLLRPWDGRQGCRELLVQVLETPGADPRHRLPDLPLVA